MSQLKAKQIKLNAAGDLLIGGTNGAGTVLTATGQNGRVLKVNAGLPTWTVNNSITSANGLNSVTATDGTGVIISVQDDEIEGSYPLVSFASGSSTDDMFTFINEDGTLILSVAGTADNIDLHLTPKGNGEVVIGSASGGGTIQSDDGTDLAIYGGAGAGNLFLNGGGTGKVYYGNDASSPSLEVATKGDLASAGATQARTQLAGNASSFALATGAIIASVIVSINGVIVSNAYYSIDASRIVTFSGLPFTLDSNDLVIFTYNIAN